MIPLLAALVVLAPAAGAVEPLSLAFAQAGAAAASARAVDPWTEVSAAELAALAPAPRLPLGGIVYRAYRLDLRALKDLLSAVPPAGLPSAKTLKLPLPEGGRLEVAVSRLQSLTPGVETFEVTTAGDPDLEGAFDFQADSFGASIYQEGFRRFVVFVPEGGAPHALFVSARY